MKHNTAASREGFSPHEVIKSYDKTTNLLDSHNDARFIREHRRHARLLVL